MEEKFYEQGGVKLRYLVLGQGQPLLFLHGVSVSTRSYLHVLEILAQKYLVIAPDLPGFGYSSVPKKIWGYQDYGFFLNQFVESLNLTKLTVVGHSFGGEIALRMADGNPDISRLVLIGATGSPIVHSLFKLLHIMWFKKFKTNLQTYKNPKILALTRKDSISNIGRKITQAITLARIILKSAYSEFIPNNKISAETIILWSDRDEILHYDSLEKLSKYLPNKQIKRLNELHDWPLFKPELLMQELENWK